MPNRTAGASRSFAWPALATAAALVAFANPASTQFSRGGWATDFSKTTVDFDEIVSGGVPRDGIPAIDNPGFIPIEDADEWLEDREPVAVLTLHGLTKVYPIQILIYHEIANDWLGPTPVSVTFCPLCNTTIAFDRRLADETLLNFGVSGNLRFSDMIMYDRQTQSWWQQATGEGIVGEYAGERLRKLPITVRSWSEVKETHPGAWVMSRETGHRRPYGENPYRGYDSGSTPILSFMRGAPRNDDRLAAMDRVVAVANEDGSESLAIPFPRLRAERVVAFEFAGLPATAWWVPGTASALDRTSIDRGREVGSTAVFSAVLEGRELSFEPAEENRFRDRETGSLWTLAGEAVEGELSGQTLTPIVHGNHFWFAMAAFRPGTEVLRR